MPQAAGLAELPAARWRGPPTAARPHQGEGHGAVAVGPAIAQLRSVVCVAAGRAGRGRRPLERDVGALAGSCLAGPLEAEAGQVAVVEVALPRRSRHRLAPGVAHEEERRPAALASGWAAHAALVQDLDSSSVRGQQRRHRHDAAADGQGPTLPSGGAASAHAPRGARVRCEGPRRPQLPHERGLVPARPWGRRGVEGPDEVPAP
mmetsp:Transcript_138735/g.431570  ORF Transcript_138735/g.431570 Transcript_138735/m.431570 type:complete len:205 (-) Transcript_138735:721-1335(-)